MALFYPRYRFIGFYHIKANFEDQCLERWVGTKHWNWRVLNVDSIHIFFGAKVSQSADSTKHDWTPVMVNKYCENHGKTMKCLLNIYEIT